ncbi:glycoside hydrolase family 18 protein [Ophiostoma piceae UAMH 11346]|uniref:chitinase n=1 Tax=Ophiostoma piceae (strain UAMH 11346) TaxID=1262450 RepID=S3BZ52_OPHP1|nr:glycoside hydrolase family 18 protein [Ophiostoma piceae UAMH 11346]
MHSWLSSTATALLAASGLVGGADAMRLRQPAAPNYRARGSECPSTCVEAGPNPANWTAYGSLNNLQRCNQTLFYHFSLHDMVDDNSVHRIYACASTGETKAGSRIAGPKAAADPETITNAAFSVGRWDENAEQGIDLASISQHVRAFLNSGYQSSTPGAEVLYAQSNGSTVGLYVGKAIKSFTTVTAALATLEKKLTASSGTSGAVALELCGKGYDSDHIFGFVATSNASFTPVQQLMQGWSSATCQSFDSDLSFAGSVTFTTPLVIAGSNSTGNGTLTRGNSTLSGRSATAHHHMNLRNAHRRSHALGQLYRRDECSTVQVVSGDSCGTLATKCGVSGDDFTKYNPGKSFCADLTPGQHVCCSSGELPDFAPHKQSNGSCYAYNVVADDNCASISATYDLTNDKIEGFNNNTWGWQGCQNLLLGAVICLSDGAPPMPSELTNAVCGPQKPGTVVGSGGTTNLSSLNPCPLNACCDIWGQCGITSDFCTDTSTGPPGTAKAGTNGCISNCGTDIVKGDAPSSYINIAYYEGFGLNRSCLFQDISQLGSGYTHVHFSFATLDSSYNVDVGDVYSQFELKRLISNTAYHRVLTFGGWAFSTEPATYSIFREGVTAANREAMASAMANYINDNDLDGVDIDWEYPGAPDIPGIPAGGDDDGANYLAFLKVLKGKLPNKTVSIAAPSSYWYLKAFPIAEISKVVDYVVFMTYDLHGQWDSDNSWSQEGCANGNCLRSHVNITETMTSLAMVTKAGVNSGKVIVGVTSYGRSFGMEDGSCWTPGCTYGGSAGESTAAKGLCTDTAGYLADAEIYDIISGTSSTVTRKKRSDPSNIFAVRADTSSARVSQYYYDSDSDSQILVYDNDQWVAFMTSDILSSRTEKYKSYNLGGVTNWASDLEVFYEAPQSYTTWNQFKNLVADGSVAPGSDYSDVTRTGNWTDLTCGDIAVSNVKTLTPYERWHRLDCDDAWNDIKGQWLEDREHKTSFSSSLQANLHMKEDIDCTVVGTSGQCSQTTECENFQKSDLGPAAFLIWNSLVLVHNMYSHYHDTLHDLADTLFGSSLDLFMDEFAPVVPKDNTWLDILLATIGFVGTIGASALFNSVLKALPFFRANGAIYDNLKDTAKALVSYSVSITGIYVSGSESSWTAESQDSFKAYMGQTIDAWDTINSNTLAQVFDGSDNSLDMLWTIISDGKLTEGGVDGGVVPVSIDADNNTLKNSINGGFYAASIPAVWRLSGKAAFIMDTGVGCSDSVPDTLSDDDAKVSNACIDDKLYLLGYPKGGYDDHCNAHGDGCDPTKFKLPPGYDALDGSAWGGVTLENLIKASVISYRANGNKNGGALPDFTSEDTVDSILDSIDGDSTLPAYLTTPGVVRLPVCSPDYAIAQWKRFGDSSLENYPCYIQPPPDFCEISNFFNQGSDASPSVDDCMQIVAQVQGTQKTWQVNTAGLAQKKLISYGSCHFGAQASNLHGNIYFHVGSQDVVDLITDAVNKFATNGKIGARGDMDCKGNINSQDMSWGIY